MDKRLIFNSILFHDGKFSDLRYMEIFIIIVNENIFGHIATNIYLYLEWGELSCFTSPLEGLWGVVLTLSVCLSVYLYVCLCVCQSVRPIFKKCKNSSEQRNDVTKQIWGERCQALACGGRDICHLWLPCFHYACVHISWQLYWDIGIIHCIRSLGLS